MNLRQLRLFSAVVQTGGFTSAAAQEASTQPAVSVAIRRLEGELDAPLFVRGSRPLALTEEGRTLLRHANAILASISGAREEVRALRSGEAGRVTLGAPPMLTGYTLPPILLAFLDERPGVALHVRQDGAERIRDGVMSGELDLGLIAGWREHAGLEVRLLRPQRMMAWMSDRSPFAGLDCLTWEILLDQPLVLFPPTYFQRVRVDQAASTWGRRPKVVVETESLALLGALAASGVGLTALLETVPPPEGVRAVPIASDADVPIAVCRRQGFPLGAAAEHFFDRLSCILGKDPVPVPKG